RNRTGSEVRHIFSKHGGSLGEPGSVSYLFDKKGVVIVQAEKHSEDDLLVAIDAGADDIEEDGDAFEIVSEPGALTEVRDALDEAGVEFERAEVIFRPQTRVEIDEEQAGKLMK